MAFESFSDVEVDEVLGSLERNVCRLKEFFSYERVARVSGNRVVKLVSNSGYWRREDDEEKRKSLGELLHERDMLDQANRLGLRVPQVHGVHGVPVRNLKVVNPFARKSRKYTIVPGLVMDFVPGIRLDDARLYYSDYWQQAVNSRDDEVSKAEKLGFVPGDHLVPKNAIFHLKEGQTYLIDLAQWDFPLTF